MNPEFRSEISSENPSINVRKSISKFGQIEHKIKQFETSTIIEIIQLVEDAITNNHCRQMGFEQGVTIFAERRISICEEIRRETSYLAGTILPKLYARRDELVSNS